MPKNVEIKAKVHNLTDLHNLAKKLSGNNGKILNQKDVFFSVPSGRLKLRSILGEQNELIFYSRADQPGPKLSTFKKVNLESDSTADDLSDLLSMALSVKGEVRKNRTLYMVGQTRIHVDEVEGLGSFMELEVILGESQPIEEGTAIARDLMKKLNIQDEDLIDSAYVDMFNKP